MTEFWIADNDAVEIEKMKERSLKGTVRHDALLELS